MSNIRTDITQGTEEWHELRIGRLTASSIGKIMGTSAAREKYLYSKAAEIVTKSVADSFTNYHMQRGHEYEPVARHKYTLSTFSTVHQVGIVTSGEYLSCSPDGFVDREGMIEIKVPDSNNYFQNIMQIKCSGDKGIQTDHYLQMQFSMYLCGKEWCDYVLYNQKHEINNKEIFIYRVVRDDEKIEEIRRNVESSIEEIESLVKEYKNI